MQQNQLPFESISVDQHRVFLIFPLDAARRKLRFLLHDTLRAMIDRIGSPAAAALAGRTGSDSECPWQRQKFNLHPDFNKRFRELFSDDADANIHVYGLCSEALAVLNASESGPGLELLLSGVARERINDQIAKKIHSSLYLTIHAVRIAWFRFSSVSMLIAELEWRLPDDKLPLDISWLIEGSYGLKHDDKLHWSRNRSAGDSVGRQRTEPEAFFTFPGLLLRLIDHAAIMPDPDPYTACYLKTNGAPSDATLDAFGIRLSLNYSLDYELDPHGANIVTGKPFNNMRHYHGFNGTTTVLSGFEQNPPKSNYMARFLENTYRTNYLTMYLCLCHEHKVLCEFSNLAGIDLLSSEDQERKLKALQIGLLSDRLTYRFSQIGRNALHDRYWTMVQQALGLPDLRQLLAEQTREIDAYLQRKAGEHSNEIMRWPLQISGAGISALTTFTIIKEFIEAIDQKWIGHTIHELAGLLAVTAGIIVALLALYLMRRAGSHPSAEEVKEHAIIENTGAVARKK
jgi:hypothetical protein